MAGSAIVLRVGGDGGVALQPLTDGCGASRLILEPGVLAPVVVFRTISHVPDEVFDRALAFVRAGLLRNNAFNLVHGRIINVDHRRRWRGREIGGQVGRTFDEGAKPVDGKRRVEAVHRVGESEGGSIAGWFDRQHFEGPEVLGSELGRVREVQVFGAEQDTGSRFERERTGRASGCLAKLGLEDSVSGGCDLGLESRHERGSSRDGGLHCKSQRRAWVVTIECFEG